MAGKWSVPSVIFKGTLGVQYETSMNIRFDVCKYVAKHYISFNMGSASKMGVASNRCTAKRNRTTINKDKD